MMISDEDEESAEKQAIWGKGKDKTCIPSICEAHIGPFGDTPTGTLHEEIISG